MPRKHSNTRKPHGPSIGNAPRSSELVRSTVKPSTIEVVEPPRRTPVPVTEPPLILGLYAPVKEADEVLSHIHDALADAAWFKPAAHTAAIILSQREVIDSQKFLNRYGKPFADGYKGFVERRVRAFGDEDTGNFTLGSLTAVPSPGIPNNTSFHLAYRLSPVASSQSPVNELRSTLVNPILRQLRAIDEDPKEVSTITKPQLVLPVGIIENVPLFRTEAADFHGSSIMQAAISLGPISLTHEVGYPAAVTENQ
jgi:hypothetical protein